MLYQVKSGYVMLVQFISEYVKLRLDSTI